ncbi:methyltransferase domain-containing protein [Xanthomonas indica]
MRLGADDLNVSPGVSSSITDIRISSSNFVAPPPTQDFPVKAEYVVADFLGYDDVAFIVNVYRAVLLREPDDSAMTHLSALRTGGMTKIEVLGEIRWSDEGKARGVHIDGLLLTFKLHRWRRTPVLGRFLHWAHAAARLHRNSRVLETHIGAVSGDLQHAQSLLARAVADQAQQLETQARSIVSLPVREEVDALAKQIEVMAEQLAELQARQVELLQVPIVPAVVAPAVSAGESESVARTSAVESHLDALYADFEDQFRGPQEQIRVRLEPYLKFIRDVGAGTPSAPVLDLGCGRGEWLELLREAGLRASGVDLNMLFVRECLRKELEVEFGDVLVKLKSLPDASIGVVSLFHLAEHLSFGSLIELIDQAHRVLVPGGGLILETPNPENVRVAQLTFYMDPTHRNPLPPQMLRWMVSARGFVQSDIQALFEARQPSDIPYVAPDVPGAATINALVKPYHEALDYAVIARKSVSQP